MPRRVLHNRQRQLQAAGHDQCVYRVKIGQFGSILQAILTKIETQNRQPDFAENYSVLSMSATSGEICWSQPKIGPFGSGLIFFKEGVW